jgi:uncharacterized protein YprB with RNaseH-like and TPR domain
MRIEPQTFLRLVEETGRLVTIDIEALGLRGDYNSVVVVSVKPFGREPVSIRVSKPGQDRAVVREAKAALERAEAWITYFGKGFDIPMLNTRLLRWSLPPIEKRPHIDMYYTLKSNLLTARRSQGHLLSWLKLPEEKMTVSADVWASLPSEPQEGIRVLTERCESDVRGLEALYDRTKHLIRDITR